MEFLLGADPEMFLVDAAGALVSSIGKIGGSKEAPRPLPIEHGYAVQEDNVALEFNIPPADGAAEFEIRIRTAMNYMQDEILNPLSLRFADMSAVSFPKDQLKDPAALVFGCDPDFNAWTGKRNPRPSAKDKTLRSCGGHLHIGVDGITEVKDIEHLIRLCDLTLGIPSVLMDKGELRKQLYGKAGAYRPKPYGAEYRSLSNFWVFKPELTKWAHDGVRRALELWRRDGFNFHMHDRVGSQIIECINNNDKELAQKFCKVYGLNVVHV